MGGMSMMHWMVVAMAATLLFGGGRVARSMGEIGQGIRQLRTGMSDDDRGERPTRPTD